MICCPLWALPFIIRPSVCSMSHREYSPMWAIILTIIRTVCRLGYTQGFFYGLVEDAKAAGERPTAAFPSSHVGVSTICILLAWHSGNRKLLFSLLPFYVFLCMATVYIQAHYAIDAIAGLITGVVFYAALNLSSNLKLTPGPSRRDGR